MRTIFYSWQSDRPTRTGRNLLEKALRKAISQLKAEAALEEAPRPAALSLDKDTQGVSGTPPLVETIFRKIDAAAVFVPDLTFVGARSDGRPMANPNVLIEYGWALKSLTHEKIVAVMNSAHGPPSSESLPFDMIHLRHPITYECADDATEEQCNAAVTSLASKLAGALKAVLREPPGQVSSPADGFKRRQPLVGLARFRGPVEPIGCVESGAPPDDSLEPVYLSGGAAMWLHVYPRKPRMTGKQGLTTVEIRAAMYAQGTTANPLNGGRSENKVPVRGVDGFGVCLAPFGDHATRATIFGFVTGEVWSVSASPISDTQGDVVFDERAFSRCLKTSGGILERLGIKGPYDWVAGIEGVARRRLVLTTDDLVRTPPPKFLANEVRAEGGYSGKEVDAERALQDFFAAVYSAAHIAA